MSASPDLGHHQQRTVHFYRNVFGEVPRQKRTKAAKMLKATHAAKTAEVPDSLESMKLSEVTKGVREGCAETLAYTDFPMQHRARIGTNNAIERLNRESDAEPASSARSPMGNPR